MNHSTDQTQYKVGTLFIKILMVFCVLVLAIYFAKHFGTQYAEKKVQEQLDRSGLAPFVDYKTLHFNPFEIAVSLEDVSAGLASAPWLTFSRITLNYHPTQPSHIDIDFWIKQSAAAELSTETQLWMRKAGIDTLLGKGSFSSLQQGESVTSELTIIIKDVGEIIGSSDIKLFDQNISMMELRTDMLASMAMGQPEGVFIIHGDAVQIQSARLAYTDMGLAKHVFPQQPDNRVIYGIIEKLGLAHQYSAEAEHIAKTVSHFFQSQNKTLITEVSPSPPITLKDATLLISDKLLYKKTGMSISNEALN
ncbi:hypothetical protein OAH87_03515 [Marinomonas sp.]|nr:hypothetical protein [Marinomonas sp.]MDB4837516.1 hypothetical protein [Marinomonas sp.]